MHGDPLAVIDVSVSDWLHARMAPPVTTAMTLISQLGSTIFVSCATLLIALLFLWRRQQYELVTLVVVVFGGVLLNILLKSAFHRHRPSFNDPVVSLTGYRFPSGHTMAATVFYGVLAAFAFRNLRNWRWGVLAIIVALLLVLVIGFSRVYLGADYLSDVLAAIAEGVAWLAISLTAVETLRRRNIKDHRERKPS